MIFFLYVLGIVSFAITRYDVNKFVLEPIVIGILWPLIVAIRFAAWIME